MPGASRKDLDSAGGTIISGSPDVFINGSSAVRVGDKVAKHSKRGAHASPVMTSGSSDVFVNGLPLVREGDSASCGHVATGSSDVFVND